MPIFIFKKYSGAFSFESRYVLRGDLPTKQTYHKAVESVEWGRVLFCFVCLFIFFQSFLEVITYIENSE